MPELVTHGDQESSELPLEVEVVPPRLKEFSETMFNKYSESTDGSPLEESDKLPLEASSPSDTELFSEDLL